MLNFTDEYEEFIKSHFSRRTGERRERLKSGHGHAERVFLENVWWPAFHRFDDLHPEYEVHDFKDGYRYIDFAFIQPHVQVAIEIDGLGPHWRNITRWKFADYCHRQNHLVIDGWRVLRFTYDDVDERPRLCQQTLHQIMGRMVGEASEAMRTLSLRDREIVRLAIRSPRPITPTQVAFELRLSIDAARSHLHRLLHASWLQPASGTIRVRSYVLHSSRRNVKL